VNESEVEFGILGQRRSSGTDVFKALALGATAVGIGAVPVGIRAFGQAGVDRVLKFFKAA
jgi:isopentenyl diphosphate isomerase/L-lactate dehydrogenase-like FMN-dependent dehydrogenase